MFNRFRIAVCVAAGWFVALPAFAQSSGAITGVVRKRRTAAQNQGKREGHRHEYEDRGDQEPGAERP